MSSVLSFALHIPRVIAVVIWIVFIEEINDGMKFQLWLQQLGYFYGGNGNEITGKWNDMIMTTCAEVILDKTDMFVGWFLAIVLLQVVLEMCSLVVICLAINIRYDKVFGNSDIDDIFSRLNVTDHTFSRAMHIFSIMTVTFSSVSIAAVIFSIVVMALPKWKSVLNIVVSSELENELRAQFESQDGGYQYSQNSATYDTSLSLSWNTLFVQAECCGVGSLIESSFMSTKWYSFGDISGNRIPVQCCISQSDVFPYSTREESNCTSVMLNGYFHSQSCDDVVEKRVKTYSIIFFVFMAITILAEMCCIIMTVFDVIRLKNLPMGFKADDDTKEIIRENEKHMLEQSIGDEANKSGNKKIEKDKPEKYHKSRSRSQEEHLIYKRKTVQLVRKNMKTKLNYNL
ncbi:unnamed protein product [Mytilus coruscus]|uniref:TSPAN18 n=1 Tax=Mytilus coruscus TaxID=42192 RepID=A0A6J8BBI0_MYTCO|nr:unnamed protein product [Mytilus coruscus]